MRAALAWLFAIIAFASLPACAETYPARPKGPVLDQADIIPATTEAGLDEKLRAYFDASCKAVVFVSVPSLKGMSIEEYATGLYNEWEIGLKETSDGILLLVAPTERKVRIEVGYGLEDEIPDAIAASILADSVLPQFKAGNMAAGSLAGVDAIVARLASTGSQPPVRSCANQAA